MQITPCMSLRSSPLNSTIQRDLSLFVQFLYQITQHSRPTIVCSFELFHVSCFGLAFPTFQSFALSLFSSLSRKTFFIHFSVGKQSILFVPTVLRSDASRRKKKVHNKFVSKQSRSKSSEEPSKRSTTCCAISQNAKLLELIVPVRGLPLAS